LERLTGAPAPIIWRVATVVEIAEETSHAKSIVLDVPGWPGHLAGQHVDVRLTAEDGYQAERSYSIASAPEQSELELTVERIDEGEVSPYLTDELHAEDQLELRGPIGGYFNWRVQDGGPLLLLAGGSGLVPLMAMLRHHAANDSGVDARLLASIRAPEDLLYNDKLARFGEREAISVHYTLTRGRPADWTGFEGRVDATMLAAVGPPPDARPLTFVCGPTAFVEHVADLLVSLGHPPATIRAERFGPTGG
jgi:ferredoxin-NADP reductase